MPESFSLTVNGSAETVTVERGTPLLYVLRNDLGLKGSRFGCGLGLCGACMVIADGQPIFSCDTPVWAVEGQSIETIEGLAANGALHPLQEAFLEHQAGQCGYCLSGIIMHAKAVLDEKPDASREEMAQALERNLCRCGSQNRILDAIETAGARMREKAAASKGAEA